LDQWCNQSGNGAVFVAPGLVFAEDDDVVPDLVWTSSRRMSMTLGSDGHFHGAPELIVEVLSRGVANEKRDREAKLKLYSRRGVDEYWIVDWLMRSVEVCRRQNAALHLVDTLRDTDVLHTPLLTGFACIVSSLFDNDVPRSS